MNILQSYIVKKVECESRMVANKSVSSLGLRRLVMSSHSKSEVCDIVNCNTPYIKNRFAAVLPYKKAQIFLGSKENDLIVAELIKPKPLSWYIVQDDKCLGFMHLKIISDDIYGNSIPIYYKNKESVLIELTSNSSYEEVDIELLRAAVRESQRLGLFGRVYARAAITDTLKGSSIPFYLMMGFKCVNKETQELVENCVNSNEKIPASCQEVMMYLPKEALSEIFDAID